LLFHKSPDYQFLKVFGCECWPYLRPYNSHKFAFCSKTCVFLGYSLSHHGYKCLDPLANRVYIAQHVVFNEQAFPFQKSSSHTDPSPSSLPGLLPLPSPFLPQNSYNPCLSTHAPRPSSSPTRVMSSSFPIPLPLGHTLQSPATFPSRATQPTVTTSPTPTTATSSPRAPQHTNLPLTSPNTATSSPRTPQHTLSHAVTPTSNSQPTCDPPPTSQSTPLIPPLLSHPMITRSQTLSHSTSMSDSTAPYFWSHLMTTRSQNHIHKPTLLPDGTPKYTVPRAFTVTTSNPETEPTCYTSAVQHVVWRDAMAEEFHALLKNGTWNIVPPTPSMNIVGSK